MIDLGRLAWNIVAKYKDKKISDAGNPIYMYSDRQIARRNNDKAKRLEKLNSSLKDLRREVKKDLTSDNAEERLVALAAALIDHTYERVGNEDSADEGHYGVTGWLKSHIKFSGGTATVKYVGKSGVKQSKTVDDADILKALKRACSEASGDSVFEQDDVKVNAAKVNDFLKKHKVTAKDLRGFHANREMREALKKVRSGKLPEDAKEAAKKLKDEWKKALEEVAALIGHEPATLASQYLVPGLKDAYLKDGTVMAKMTKNSSAIENISFRFQGNRVDLSIVNSHSKQGGYGQVLVDENLASMLKAGKPRFEESLLNAIGAKVAALGVRAGWRPGSQWDWDEFAREIVVIPV